MGTDIVRTLTQSPTVATVTSPWTAPPSAATSLISKDGTIGVIVAGITGGDNSAPKNAGALISTVVHNRDDVTVRAGGESTMMLEINQQSEKRPESHGRRCDSAEFPGAGVGVRRSGRGVAAPWRWAP